MRAALIGLLLLLPPAATVASNWQEQARVHGGRKPHGSDPPPRVVPCEAPVRRAEVVLPASLLTSRRPLPFRMHSGYINVTEEDYLFYWHFESQLAAEDPEATNAPIVLWSNGGPGCSAMEGATTEHGPLVLFDIKESALGESGKLSENPYAWNKKAHVVYVDQPRYVGFSCGSGDYVSSSINAGLDIVQFIQGWKSTFPEHADREWIIAAESYGGHYIPAWAGAILDHNQNAGAQGTIRLKGIAIGNGIINETVQSGSFAEFARAQGLISAAPSPEGDNEARMLVEKTLGYSPNFYDYRLKSIDCCGCTSYNYSAWATWFTRPDVKEALNVCGSAGDPAFVGCGAGCVDLPNFDANDNFDYSGALSRALQHGVAVTFYYGKQDTACNYVGGFAVASMLEWAGRPEFAAAPLKDLVIGGAVTGSWKQSNESSGGKLTWVEVDAAGHMVPLNNGAAGYFAISTLTN